MIVKQEDFMEQIYAKYPHFTEASLDNICKKGMSKLNSFMKSGNEVIIKTEHKGEEIKFFIPMTPEDQQIHSTRQYYKKLRRKQEDDEQKKSGE